MKKYEQCLKTIECNVLLRMAKECVKENVKISKDEDIDLEFQDKVIVLLSHIFLRIFFTYF